MAMESVVFDKSEVVKGTNNGGQRYGSDRKFLRILEFCFALFIFFSFFSYLPISEILRRVFSVFQNTFYVFLISNVIIFTIVLSFKNFSGGNSVPDLYDEFVASSEYHNNRVVHLTAGGVTQVVKKSPAKEFEDKGIILEEKKSYRRRKTEKLAQGMVKKSCRGLWRSETEVCRIMVVSGEGQGRKAVDEMSGDEFRQKIEAFIARQKWNQKQEQLVKTGESMAIRVG